LLYDRAKTPTKRPSDNSATTTAIKSSRPIVQAPQQP